MAVVQMSVWRPKAGRMMEFAAQVAEAKAIHERLGAVVSVWQPIAGGQAGTFTYVMTFEDLAAYGAAGKALTEDAEWTAWWLAAQADPTADPVEVILAGEVPGA